MPIPLSLSPSLWLPADTLSPGTLAVWPDGSGSGESASPASGDGEPNVIAGLNGMNVVQFSLTESMESIIDLSSGDWTVAVVARMTAGDGSRLVTSDATRGGNNWLLGWYNGAEDQAYFNTVVKLDSTPSYTTDWRIYGGSGASGVGSFYGGSPAATPSLVVCASGCIGPKTLGINCTQSQTAPGQVAELIAFSRALSPTDWATLWLYLYNKWFSTTTPPKVYSRRTRTRRAGCRGVAV